MNKYPLPFIGSCPPIFKTRSGSALPPRDTDDGVPLQPPVPVNVKALLHEVLKDRALAATNGAMGNEDNGSVSTPEDYRHGKGELQASASLLAPKSDIYEMPQQLHVAVSSATPTPDRIPMGRGSGRVLADGLTKAQFHKKKRVEKKRAIRREERAKLRAAATLAALKEASAVKHGEEVTAVPEGSGH
ncbi:hypothetical protein L227DRAFT_612078 [Lentinus tigrinus ALCF2SS1-6]|uniref:Uncharacterized protein n=1 Tax=Lentinus tigrinus ALCF2SS1-6 TaxID=1328759 RepID=A0A5C2S6X3_9APHY|nr:hypothetical protein L227DRAFT_612078 [Lentinus tigrinus ALCF2SS1-6]